MNTNNSQSNQTESIRIKPTKDYVYPRIEPPPNHRSTQPEPNWTNNPPPNTHKRPNASIPSTNPRKPNTQTMSNPKNPINCWISRPEKSKIQSITEHPHQKEDESSEKRGKNEKKKTNRRTQCKETERKQKLAQRRGRNHTSSNTKNDPKPAHEPASWPDRAAVSHTARRSLC